MIIGSRIKELRVNLNMSQQELGDLLGITKVSICGYENGSRIPSLDNFRAMADIFGVSADYLLGREITVVREEETDYITHLSGDEVRFINELKKYPTLYSKLTKDSKRSIEMINKKL